MTRPARRCSSRSATRPPTWTARSVRATTAGPSRSPRSTRPTASSNGAFRRCRTAAFVPQQNMYTQPTADGVFMLPGANGGEEWSPIAVHPELGYAYTVGLHQPMHYKVHYAPWENGRLWLGSAFVRVPDDKGGYS